MPLPQKNGVPAFHLSSAEETLQILQTSSAGLSSREASARSLQFGANELASGKKRTAIGLFFSQFKDFMILMLLAAAVISALAGDLKDTFAIAAILILNAVIGFTQEFRAERAMEALKKMAAPSASVVRDGKNILIPASGLVPGDIVLLESGRIVPADLRLIEAAQLRIDESALTGESVPVDKTVQAITDPNAPLGDRKNTAYKGTVVTYGRGTGAVAAIGMQTEFGKIAALLQTGGEVKTPLQKRLASFGRRLSMAAIVICAVVFATGILRGEPVLLMFLTAVSLAVAAIPEALPAVVTISLALGAKKMVQQKALVRKLPAVETLGSVTYICTDKTGTLTMNRMRAEEFFCGEVLEKSLRTGGAWDEFLTGMALCSDAVLGADDRAMGDPTETALYDAARQKGFQREALEVLMPRAAEIPFDSARKCMTTFHQKKESASFISYTKGAVEVVLENSSQVLTDSGLVPLLRERYLEIAERMAGDGLRVLALAKRDWDALPKDINACGAESGLVLLGLVGIVDPPREEAREAVQTCKTAGIIPVMITGDHPATAAAIARRLGILEDSGQVMTGAELEKIPSQAFAEQVEKIRVYARVSPEQKLKIVTALQERGQFAAMTGDGVNDAPALKRADIGVAMGISGTDVAKESSAMILLDDNFATIVRAVKEGRRIYDNMRRFIRYAVSTNSAEVWIIFLAPFFGLPIPFLPIQILWINLLTDGLPGLALAAEPAEKNVMNRPPRPPRENVFANGLGAHVIWVGILMAALVLGAEKYLIQKNCEHWRSFLFTLVCFSQLAHVMAIRSESESLFTQGLLTNKPLLFAVALTTALHLSTLYIPALNSVFQTQPLTVGELVAVTGLSSIVFFAVEIEKWIRRRLKS